MTKIKSFLAWLGNLKNEVLASYFIGLAMGLITEWISIVYAMGWGNYVTFVKAYMERMYGF